MSDRTPGGRMVVVGTGRLGLGIARALAEHHDVVLAGRRLDEVRRQAHALDVEAAPVALNAATGAGLAQIVRPGDLVINAAGDDPKARLLRACVAEGADFADLTADPAAIAGAREVDDLARRAGVSALVGIGLSPGITNLLAQVVVGRLRDAGHTVDSVRVGLLLSAPDVFRTGAASRILDPLLTDLTVERDGTVRTEVPFRDRRPIDFPGSGTFPGFEYGLAETWFLPEHLGVDRVDGYLALRPSRSGRRLTRLVGGARRRRLLRHRRVRQLVAFLMRRRFRGDRGNRVAVVAVAASERRQVSTSLAGRDDVVVTAACVRRIVEAWDRSTPGVHVPETTVDPAECLADPGRDGLELTATDTILTAAAPAPTAGAAPGPATTIDLTDAALAASSSASHTSPAPAGPPADDTATTASSKRSGAA